jgi:hypothetical protein
LHGKLPELAETPLLLKMLCDVFDPETGKRKIPESKGELFQWFSQKFDNWKEQEGVRTSEKFWKWNKELLRHLALVMIQNNGSVLPQPSIGRDEIANILEKYLTGRVANPGERAKDWRDDLIDFHLLQDAAESGKIEFYHQLFQEYYAAEQLRLELVKHPEFLDKQIDEKYSWFQHHYLNYTKWIEPIELMLGLPEIDQKTAVTIIEKALNVDLLLGLRLIAGASALLNMLLGSRLLEDISGAKISPDVKLALDIYLSSQPLIIRRQNEKACKYNFSPLFSSKKEHKTINSKAFYIQRIKDINGSLEDKENAIVGLRKYKNDPEAIRGLSWALEEKSLGTYLRSLSAKSLALMGHQVPYACFKNLLSDPNNSGRLIAIQALGLTRCRQAIPELMSLFSESENYMLMSAVISALLNIDSLFTSPCVEKFLRELDLAYDKNEDLRECESFDIYNRFLSCVLLDLEDDPNYVRQIIIKNLPTICNEENLTASFIEVCEVNSSHTEQWISTVELLAKAQYRPAISIIRSMLYSEDECSWEAINIVRRLHLREFTSDLINVLSTPKLPNFLLEEASLTLSLFLVDSTLPCLSEIRDKVLADAIKAPSYSSRSVQIAVRRVQLACKFYNYEIFHSPPVKPQPTQQDTLATIATTIDIIDQRTKQMADQPARIFHIQGNYIEKVEGGYHEHNYAPQANLKETEQLTRLLQKLRTSNPNATEEQIFDILLRGFQTMPQNNPQNWQSWQDILGLIFVGGIEGIKILEPLAAIPIEVGRKLYDIYDRNRKQLPGD